MPLSMRFRISPPLAALSLCLAAGPMQAQTVRKAQPVRDEALVKGESTASRQRAYAAVASAETAVRRDPHDPRAVAARAAALCQAGRAREAVDYLMELKTEYLDFFPHQLALADAFAAARMFSDAAAAYEVVVNDPQYGMEQWRAAKERSRNMGRDPRLIAGEHAVRTNDSAAARRALPELRGDATRPDVVARQASVLTKERRYAEARALLDKPTATGDSSRPVAEARATLAESEANTGAWGPAAADYRAAENEENLSKLERHHAARMSREMLARVRPAIQQDVSVSHQHEGTLWTSGIELSTGAFGDGMNIVFLRGIWDEIGLGHQRLISQADADRYQAELAWRRLTSKGFFGEVAAGGGDQEAMFGASIGRYEVPGPGWELRFRANERATDSLVLMALGGTQDGISFNIHRRFSEHWYIDATLGWRRVEVAGLNLGEGIDLDFRLAWTLVEETDRRPSVSAGYFADVHRFYRNCVPDYFAMRMLRWARREPTADDWGSGLIDDRINRHGLTVTASKKFGARFSGFVYGGVAYEFEAGRTEGLAGAGITAYLSRNASLILGVDYSSSGNTFNKGDDVVIGTVKVRVSF